MAPARESGDSLLAARASVPEHVVHRDFGGETVILNLQSGMYHGLNGTAAAMLEALRASDSVAAAIDRIADQFSEPREVVEADVVDLCRALVDRNLIELDGGG